MAKNDISYKDNCNCYSNSSSDKFIIQMRVETC